MTTYEHKRHMALRYDIDGVDTVYMSHETWRLGPLSVKHHVGADWTITAGKLDISWYYGD